MYKSELLKLYANQGLSASQLRFLLNKKYFDQLAPLGYKKQSQFIPPIAVRKFFEIFGEPIKDDETNR